MPPQNCNKRLVWFVSQLGLTNFILYFILYIEIFILHIIHSLELEICLHNACVFFRILMFPIVFHMVSLKNNSERNRTKIHSSFLKIASSLSFEIIEVRGFCYSNFCFPWEKQELVIQWLQNLEKLELDGY